MNWNITHHVSRTSSFPVCRLYFSKKKLHFNKIPIPIKLLNIKYSNNGCVCFGRRKLEDRDRSYPRNVVWKGLMRSNERVKGKSNFSCPSHDDICGGEEVVLQLLWSLPSVNCMPWPLYSWDRTRYPLSRRLGGSQSRSGRSGEEKHFLPLPGFRTPDGIFPIWDPHAWNKLLARQAVDWRFVKRGFDCAHCVGLETC